MANYTGLKCPICNKEFTSNDDIVVCPSCGAPYHRECFEKEGKCIFEDKHASGFTWKPDGSSENTSENNVNGDGSAVNSNENKNSEKICPICSHYNNSEALFCERCGHSFADNKSNSSQYQNTQSSQNATPPPFNMGAMPLTFDPLGGVDPNEDFDGVKASELAKYVKNSTPYYLRQFKNIKDKNSTRFNFGAFIFSGGWLLYRRQYKWGSIIGAFLLIGMIISNVLNLFFSQAVTSAGAASSFNSQNILSISQQISSLPWYSQLVFYLPLILYAIQFIIMIILGIRGNRMYMKHCIKTVKKIKSQNLSNDEFEKKLYASGGVNTALAMILLFVYVIISYIPLFI